MDADYIAKLEQQVHQLSQELKQTKAQLQAEQYNRLQTELSLAESKERLYSILDFLDAGIAFVDIERRYRFVNRFYEVRFNRTQASMLGKHVWEVIGVEAYNGVKNYIDLALQGEPQTFDFGVTYENGQHVYLNGSLTPAYNRKQQVIGYYLFVFDITDRHRLEQSLKAANTELKHLATLDGLTHIANRRQFDHYLKQAWQSSSRSQQPLSLIMLDIDYFKRYNDYYGHQLGDECLIKIAQTVAATIHRETDLVARYGGEEFAIILPNTNLSGAIVVAEQVQGAVRSLDISHAYSDVSDIISISLGISCLVATRDRLPKHIIASADRALYAAKQQGRDRYAIDGDCTSEVTPI